MRWQQNYRGGKVKFETKVLKAENRDYSYEFPALLVGEKEIDIVPQVGGRIMKKNFEAGQMVSRGQVLYVLDQTSYRLEVQNRTNGITSMISLYTALGGGF